MKTIKWWINFVVYIVFAVTMIHGYVNVIRPMLMSFYSPLEVHEMKEDNNVLSGTLKTALDVWELKRELLKLYNAEKSEQQDEQTKEHAQR